MNKEQFTINDIFLQVPGYIYWKDINGVYLGCNQAEAEILGFKSAQEVIGKTDYDLSWRYEAEYLREIDQRIMQTEVSEEVREQVTLSNGKIATMLTKKAPLYDDEHNVIGIIGVSVNVEKEEKKNGLKTQFYINNILQHIPGYIYWKDINGVYLGCNQAEAEILGFKSAQEVIGKTDYDLSWQYEAEILRETDQRIIQTQTPEETIESGIIANNKIATMLTKKAPFYDDKYNVIGVIGVSIDITDRKEKEELEHKLEMQKELFRIAQEVAHDIHSPLMALETFRYLVSSKLTEQENRILDLLKKGINGIVSKLIEKYKETKEGNYNKGVTVDRKEKEEIIDVKLAMEEVIERKMYEYSKKNVKIKYEEKEKGARIKGEKRDFERMMSNIINNGIEAVEGNGAEIELGYKLKEKEVEIRVKDNGKGMLKEVVEDLLKGKKIRTTKENGHGIGMQQIISTIKEMNGQLNVKSEENLGTEFILMFPKS